MKNLLILLIFLGIGFLSYGQEVEINASIAPNAGNSAIQTENALVNISKWRLGEIYMLTLPLNEIKDEAESEWKPKVFPNPFSEKLKISIKTNEIKQYTISITDLAGKRSWFLEEKTVLPNQIITLELGNLKPAIYLLNIVPKNSDNIWVGKIQKQ